VSLTPLEPIVRFDVNADGERSDEVPRVRRGDCLYRVLVGSGRVRAPSSAGSNRARRSQTAESGLEPSLDTYFDHVHFTPAGARRFAEVVAAAVLRRPLSSSLSDTRASGAAALRLRAVS
jgi:hypothetical protein